jgi:tetratricopeptide (TPR) repeat protein
MPHIERAIEIDPEFALAYAVRGRIHVVRAWRSTEWPGSSPYDLVQELALARGDALRSLEIDEDLGAGHGVLGAVESAAGNDREARERFERALALSPNDNVIMYWYTVHLLSRGERPAALEVTERMRAQNSDTVTELMLLAGDIEGAAEVFTAPIEPEASSFPVHALAGTGHLLLGRNEAAEREFRLAEALLPPVSEDRSRPMNPWRSNRFLPMIIYGYGRLGLKSDAERVFQMFETAAASAEGPRAITTIYAYVGIGDIDEAYRLAEEFVADPTPAWATGRLSFVLNPLQDPVLDRPEFVELRRRLGFRG